MFYRDDQAAQETRRDELRRELDDHRRAAEVLAAQVRRREEIERELAEVERRLARAQARRVPLLEDVRVASPCDVAWEGMVGDERVRFCGQCQKNVYNLSAMAREEAERLLAEREGSICVRLYKRADGTVLTADCSVGARRKRRRRQVAALAGAGAIAAAVAAAMADSARATPEPLRMQGAWEGPEVHARYVLQRRAKAEPGLAVSFSWERSDGSSGEWRLYTDYRVELDTPQGTQRGTLQTVDTERLVALASSVAAYQTDVPYNHDRMNPGLYVYGKGDRAASPEEREEIYRLFEAIAP